MERIYCSKVPDYAVPEGLSLHQFLTQYNPDLATRDQVILEDLSAPFKKLTYGSLREKAALGAAALSRRYHLQPGDCAIIYSTNSVNYSLFAHAIMWMGGVIAGVNTAWTGHELVHSIQAVEPKVIACEPGLRDRVEQALKTVTGLKERPQILELGDTPGCFPRSFIDDPPREVTPLPAFDLSDGDSRKHPCLILFSSGTTGPPKAVLLSHHNLIAHLMSARTSDARLNSCTAREVFFAPLPHMMGVLGALLVPAYVGSYIGIMRQFDLENYIKACSMAKATILKMVPSIMADFVQHPLTQDLDLTSVDTLLSAGAALKPEVVAKLQRLLKGVNIVQGYGMSEAGVCTLPPHKSVAKSGSVGRLFPSVKVRIVDENLQDVQPGQPGELLLRSPTVFMGYKNNEKATKESFHNGWLRTGDVLSIDDDGFLWFCERKKEMIKVKGNQVAPSELEGILSSHDLVLGAAVCGYFDDTRQTEWPIGYVTLSPSVPGSERDRVLDEIRAWVDGQVATYKRLRGGLHHIDALPKNPTGKLMRSQLPIKLAEKRKARM
ncbi:amp dependent CoA ligase [Aspergillus californicus]